MPSAGLPIENILNPRMNKTKLKAARLILSNAEHAIKNGLFIEWLESFVGAWNETKDPFQAVNAWNHRMGHVMSYHEIEVVKRWHVFCTDCDLSYLRNTAGEAEKLAIDHINGEAETVLGKEKSPGDNYNHTVKITEYTMVGRQVDL